MTSGRREAPIRTDEGQAFWDGAVHGVLRLQACDECGCVQHPPRLRCSTCGAAQLSARGAAGRGIVYGFALPRHPANAWNPEGTAFVVVALEEGVRVFGNLIGLDAAPPKVGLEVEVCFERVASDHLLPVWRPRAGSAS